MIVEIKLGVNDHVADVIEHYRDYGFESREALVEQALQLLEQKTEKDRLLAQSAQLYELDEETNEWLNASLGSRPQSYRIPKKPGYKTPVLVSETLTDEEKAEAREAMLKGGSQTLDVEAMIANNKADRPMPFRDSE